jgi:hypothetical protein
MVAVALVGSVRGAETAILLSTDRELQFQIHIPDNPGELYQEVDNDSTVRLYTTTLIGLPPGATAVIVSAVGQHPKLADINQNSKVSTSGSLARLLKPFTVRGKQLVGLRVYPVTGQSIYQQVEVKIRYTGGQTGAGASISDPFFDRLSKAAVVNYQQLSQWPTTIKPALKVSSQSQFGVTSDWYKINTSQNGLYKVTGAQLQ